MKNAYRSFGKALPSEPIRRCKTYVTKKNDNLVPKVSLSFPAKSLLTCFIENRNQNLDFSGRMGFESVMIKLL